MNASIILEYTCTDAELRQARSLGFRKSRQKFAILAMYGLFLLVIYFRIRGDVAPKYQPYFILIAVGLILLFHFGLRPRRKPGPPTKLALAEDGLHFLAPDSNMDMPWTAFSKCLESQNLFVLVNRPEQLIYALPKRAFPNEEAINWFRERTSKLAMSEAATPPTPAAKAIPTPADGVSISFELEYGDYLNLMLASWRFKGVVLLVYGIIFGQALWDLGRPSSGDVNPPLTVLILVLSPITAMMLLFLFGVPFLKVRAQRRHFGPQKLLLGEDGIRFAERDASGALPWSTYRYFKETRRGFILWKPGGIYGGVGLLIPKRAFVSADIERTRSLLNRHLRHSRWYF